MYIYIYIYIQNRPYFGFWEVESTQMYIEKSTIICVGIFQQMYQHICWKNKCIYVDSAKKTPKSTWRNRWKIPVSIFVEGFVGISNWKHSMDFRFLHKKQTAKPTSKPVPHLVCHDQESGVDMRVQVGAQGSKVSMPMFQGILGDYNLPINTNFF